MSSEGDFWKDDDPQFLDALATVILSGERVAPISKTSQNATAQPFNERNPVKVAVHAKRPRSPSPSPGPSRKKVDPSKTHIASQAKDRVYKVKKPEDDIDYESPSYVYGPASFGGFGEYMRRKRAKLQIQNKQLVGEDGEAVDDVSVIFKGVAIYVNGLTEPPYQELREMVMAHGGVFHAYLDKKSMVTHIVASQLTPTKINEYQRGKMKVVTPDWIVKSIEAGTLLRWQDFMLKPTSVMSAFAPKGTPGEASDRTPSVTKLGAVDEAAGTSSLPQRSLLESLSGNSQRRPDDTRSPASSGAIVNVSPTASASTPFKAAPKSKSAKAKADPHAPSTGPTGPGVNIIPPTPLEKINPGDGDVFLSPKPKKTLQAWLGADNHTPTDSPQAKDPLTAGETSNPDRPSYALHDSNPFAQKLISSSGWRANHTSASEGFAESYFQHSRLHHLSAWKSELKALVLEARQRADAAAQAVGDQNEDGVTRGPEGTMDGVSMRGFTLNAAGPTSTTRARDGVERDVDGAKVPDRVIMHCDFDSFFVAAGLLDRPHLKGKPVVVCHGGTGGGMASTSEIASASYEAREFGIKNGMSLGQCRQLCSSIVTIPYEFEKYKALSLKFYTILMSYADDLQACSVDEALIDVSNRVLNMRLMLSQESGDQVADDDVDLAKELAEEIRTKIREATSCEVSIGISHNILLARLATRKAKPAGSFHLLPSQVSAHLAPLKLTSLHGVGRSIRDKLEEKFQVETLGELLDKSKDVLKKTLGDKTGEKIWKAVRGIDDTALESDKPRKSVSAEVNYGIRFQSNEEAEVFIRTLCKEVSKRLKDVNKRGRSLTLKIMKRRPDAPIEAAKFLGHGIVDSFSKATSISGPSNSATDDAEIISKECWKLLKAFQFDPKDLRGIGIQIQKLEDEGSSSVPAPSESGQSLLQFKRGTGGDHDSGGEATVDRPAKRQKGKQKAAEVEIIDVDAEDSAETSSAAVLQPTRQNKERIALPPASQFDPTVLESLPEDIRREILANYNMERNQVAGASTSKADAGASRDAAVLETGQPHSTSAQVGERPNRSTKAEGSKPRNVPIDETVPDPGPSVRSQSVPAHSSQPHAAEDTLAVPKPVLKAVSVSPTKRASKAASVKHITKQLAPKHKVPVTSPSRLAMFKKRPNTFSVSDGELEALGVDVGVFRQLPLEIQKEQIATLRVDMGQGTREGSRALGEDGDEIVELKPFRKGAMTLAGPGGIFSRAPTKSRSPSVAHQRMPAPAVVRKLPIPIAEYAELPRINKLSATVDVQGMITAWVEYRVRDGEGPIEVEVDRVEKYMTRCVKSGDVGTERVVSLLKWWRLELRERWGSGDENLARTEFGTKNINQEGLEQFSSGVSREWWAAWWRAKRGADEVVKDRFGCGLALRG